ncbi:hypothetical protein HanIR_Chr01g0004061 [Helianthus annuus]|nr:hypothetical protein HanIR_Chr01g0004061 [Helianthus annuus]
MEDYSVGTVRRILKKGTDHSSNYVKKWCKWILMKCNIHAWRAEMDKIPTRMALRSRNVEIEDLACPYAELKTKRAIISSLLVWWRVECGIIFRDGVKLHLLLLTRSGSFWTFMIMSVCKAYRKRY